MSAMKRREFITLLGGAAVASAKSDPVAAGDGAVSVMERIWPAFQDIDTSSGALGTAGGRTLDELIPILIEAPADHSTRSKWLKRLFEAVQGDGVPYLSPVENRFDEIALYPDLTNAYADELLPLLRKVWSDQKHFEYVSGTQPSVYRVCSKPAATPSSRSCWLNSE